MPAASSPQQAGSAQHYSTSKYAPRGPVVYVASLYADDVSSSASRESQEQQQMHGNPCACGSADPLHVHDASAGTLASQGLAATHMSGYGVVRQALSARSCDSRKYSMTWSGPPAGWTGEVDQLTSPLPLPPPSRSYNRAHGLGKALPFDAWIEAKDSEALRHEAERKRRAVAELSAQISRRAQAQEAFREWRAEKQLQLQQTPSAASTSANPAAAALATSSAAQQAAESERSLQREALFAVWRSSKDAARVAALKQAEAEEAACIARENEARERSKLQGAEAHAKFAAKVDAERVKALAAKREARARERAAAAESKRQRAARSKEQLAQWKQLKAAADAAREKTGPEVRARLAAEEAKAKRAEEVERTRLAREQLLAAHLAALELDRAKSARIEARKRKAAHSKQAWSRHPAEAVVAYSTRTSAAHVFR